jgi:steroid 5-alpha reductase family enzyme
MALTLFTTGLLISLVVIFLHFVNYFWIAVKQNNFGIIDIGWGQGFVLVVWVLMLTRTFLIGVNPNIIGYLTLVLTTIWGLRLSSHIHKRNHGKPEDKRYVAMRAKILPPYVLLKSFVRIFLVQALFMFVISFVLIANIMSGIVLPLQPISYVLLGLGLLVWFIGFYFQAVGDQQLATFIQDPKHKGQLITTGLWRYTRHPNYFGEVMMWWGIAILGFANSFEIVYPIIALLSPLIVTWLLRFVSGVPLLEKHMKTKPGFDVYEKTTNIFFPWFPKAK